MRYRELCITECWHPQSLIGGRGGNPYPALEPKTRIDWSMPAAEALINAPEFTVSELSSALKRTVED
ncbi:MAG: hypothetical protein WA303_16475, partial [Bradyrhizobium sp.]